MGGRGRERLMGGESRDCKWMAEDNVECILGSGGGGGCEGVLSEKKQEDMRKIVRKRRKKSAERGSEREGSIPKRCVTLIDRQERIGTKRQTFPDIKPVSVTFSFSSIAKLSSSSIKYTP